MIESAVFSTDLTDSQEAGRALGEQVRSAFGGGVPDAAIVFASPDFDYTALLRAIDSACRPLCMVGCSSAGEFTNKTQGTGLACIVALRSDEMAFAAGVGRGIAEDSSRAAAEVVASFKGIGSEDYVFHSAIVLTDALAGHADEMVEELTLLTAGAYQLVGGGAGDDDRFQRTHVFYGVEAIADAVVALEILSNKPIGVGVQHGWQPASEPLRVTEAEGTRLISLNATPAADLFEEHAAAQGQTFNRADPLPFFMHNVIGIDTGIGYKLRVPLAVNEDGSISCAAEVPEGATVRIMAAAGGPAEAAGAAIRTALERLDGSRPRVALFFDCVATRLRLGEQFGAELGVLKQELQPAQFAGCNTYGQIARSEGQFSGFHNCTAVVFIIPE